MIISIILPRDPRKRKNHHIIRALLKNIYKKLQIRLTALNNPLKKEGINSKISTIIRMISMLSKMLRNINKMTNRHIAKMEIWSMKNSSKKDQQGKVAIREARPER